MVHNITERDEVSIDDDRGVWKAERLAGTQLFVMPKESKATADARLGMILRNLTLLNTGQYVGNIHQRLKAYNKFSQMLIEEYRDIQLLLTSYRESWEQIHTGQGSQNRKRWTTEQDEALIELACENDASMIGLALNFNRTPAAISSRLTYLVGVSKISRSVVGRLVGYLDGVEVDGHFEGSVSREVTG